MCFSTKSAKKVACATRMVQQKISGMTLQRPLNIAHLKPSFTEAQLNHK